MDDYPTTKKKAASPPLGARPGGWMRSPMSQMFLNSVLRYRTPPSHRAPSRMALNFGIFISLALDARAIVTFPPPFEFEIPRSTIADPAFYLHHPPLPFLYLKSQYLSRKLLVMIS